VTLSEPPSSLGSWVAARTIGALSLKTITVPEHFGDGAALVCRFLSGGALIEVGSFLGLPGFLFTGAEALVTEDSLPDVGGS